MLINISWLLLSDLSLFIHVKSCCKYVTCGKLPRHYTVMILNCALLFVVHDICSSGLKIISVESPDTMTGQFHFSSVTYRFWAVKFINETKVALYISKHFKSLLRAYSTLKHSLSIIKLNYSGKTKISLCVLK